ncbi:hypothetical protein BT69DRAFT_1239533 [Atractiella rhizophila]|nr:hypothetical protein BT69DRAFT_1239533 [Atractiella rhizophila]
MYYLESAITPVLNRYVNQFFEVHDQQLSLGYKDTTLKDVRLKKEALDKLGLPLDVVDGYAGELRISIPWLSLGSSPSQIRLTDLYLVASPSNQEEANVAEDEKRAFQRKMDKLKNSELLLVDPNTGTQQDEQKSQSFVSALISKVVNNIQITIENVHIRYQDAVSVPGHPFAVGLVLGKLSIQSSDENWMPAFIADAKKSINKLMNLERLGVYFDTDAGNLTGEEMRSFIANLAQNGTKGHQFILSPVSSIGHLTMSHRIDHTTPKWDVELFFDQLAFVLDEDQYRDALSMLELFHFYIRKNQYRKFRPQIKEFEKNRAKAFWRFAGSAIISEIHEKHRQWSWAFFKERRNDRKEYISLFKAQEANKQVPLQPEDKAMLDALERKLSFRDLRFYRSIARSQMRKEARQVERQNTAASVASNKPAGGGGWWGYLTGSHSTNTSKGENLQPGLNDEQRQELYEVIDYDEASALTAAVDLPRDTLKARVKANLQRGSLALRRDPHGSNSDLIAISFNDFDSQIIQRPDNLEASLHLGGMEVRDGTVPNSVYKEIVRVKHEGSSAPISRSTSEQMTLEPFMLEQKKSGSPFFSLWFEHKPLDDRADNSLTVRMREMEVIYHRGYIEEIFKFFRPPQSQLESVGALIDVASMTFEGLRNQTRAGFEFALENHKTIDMQLDLNAPVIIIPEDVTRRDCQHVVLDAGHISVESDLASKELLNDVNKKVNQEYSEEDWTRLESLMYDKFTVKLQSTQLLIGNSLEDCLMELHDQGGSNTDVHILEKMNMSFLAQNSIIPKAPNLTRFKLTGTLPDFRINFSDRKYKMLMRMIDIAIPHFDDEPNELPAIPPPPRNRRLSILPFGAGEEDEPISFDGDEEEKTMGSKEKDEFFEASEGDSLTWKQKIFEFSFTVNQIKVAIFKSLPNKPERLLVNAVLQNFDFLFTLRPKDLGVDVNLRTLYIEDCIAGSKNPYKHLISSKDFDQQDDQGEDLVKVKYFRVQKDSPEFKSVYNEVDQSVQVDLSTINLVITRASILNLYDWIMTTFTNQGSPSPQPQASTTDQVAPTAEPSSDRIGYVAECHPFFNIELFYRVKVNLTSIVAVLNEDGTRLGTLSLSAGSVNVLVGATTLRVDGRLGSLSLVDDYKGSSHLPHRTLLSIEGNEVADFVYETFDHQDEAYPGYDARFYLRTGSLHFVVNEGPVHRILVFLSKFARMKAVYDATTQAAAEQANQLQERVQKMHYDILIQTPIIVFPREPGSTDTIIANLGEISAKNRFEADADGPITKIDAGLKSIKLVSKFDQNELHILEDVDVTFDITQVDEAVLIKNPRRPGLEILTNMSDVRMGLTQKQYITIMSLIQVIPRTFIVNNDELDQSSLPTIQTHHDDTRAVAKADLYPELSRQAVGPNGELVTLRSNLELDLKAKSIYLEIFTEEATDVASLVESSLSRFTLNDLGVRFKMMSNSAMEAEIIVRSFTLIDTRPSKSTKFSEIIPPTKFGGYQFMMSYTQGGIGDDSSTINIDVDSPKIIFSLELVFALLAYFTSPFQGPGYVEEPRTIEPDEEEPTPPPQQSTSGGLRYRINVVSPTVVLLEDANRQDSQAIVLSIGQFILTQQTVLSLMIKEMGMFFCSMDRQKDQIRFLDNFDVSLSMDSRSEGLRIITSVDLRLTELVLRVSYRDVLLIQRIVNKAAELSSTSNSDVSADKSTRAISNRTDVTERITSKRSNRKALPRAEVVMSKEQLRAKISSFQMIVIGDVHELPMLDLKTEEIGAEVKDWSGDLKAEALIKPYINYFNLKNSHWEPLIDPWEFAIKLNSTSNPSAFNVDLSSNKRLELNVTSSFIELALTTMNVWATEGERVLARNRGDNSPFRIRNLTGYSIVVAPDIGKKKGKVERAAPAFAPERIPNGGEIPWRFEDWKTMRENINAGGDNTISVKVENGHWDSVRQISFQREGKQVFHLKPRIENITHRLVCDIQLKDNVKIVTFRSPFVIENFNEMPIDLEIVDTFGKAAATHSIPPGESYAVPIEAAYNQRLRFRPDKSMVTPKHGVKYSWSSEAWGWQDLVKEPGRTVICKATNNEPPLRFRSFSIYDQNDPLTKSYPNLTLRIRAPVEIQNLLPYDLTYRLFDKNLQLQTGMFVRKGLVSPCYFPELNHLCLLSVKVEDTPFKRSEFAVISTDNTEDMPLENLLSMRDDKGLEMFLRLNFVRHPYSGGAYRIQVFSPYVFINKTGLSLELKFKTFMMAAKTVAGIMPSPAGSDAPPIMLSYPTDDNRNRTLLKLEDSSWSDPQSFEAVGTDTVVRLPKPGKGEERLVGLRVAEGLGDYKLTKVVTIYPRFMVKNNTPNQLRVREVIRRGGDEILVISPGGRAPLNYLKASTSPRLKVSFTEGQFWSRAFKPEDLGIIHCPMSTSNDSNEDILLKIDTELDGPILFTTVSIEEGSWPYLVRNESEYVISFCQSDIGDGSNTGVARMQIDRHKHRVYPNQSQRWAWDEPTAVDKFVKLSIGDSSRAVNLMEIGALTPFRFVVDERGKYGIVSLDVKVEGPVQVLEISNYRPEDSVYKVTRKDTYSSIPRSPSARTSTLSLTHGDIQFEAISPDIVASFSFALKLAGVGVSVVNSKMQELIYVTFRGLQVELTDYNTHISYELSCKWIQVDNQLFGAEYPIVLAPSVLPSEGADLDLHPNLTMVLTILKNADFGITYIKYFQFLLQEWNVEMDEDFIFALLDFVKSSFWPMDGTQPIESKLIDEAPGIPEPRSANGNSDVYFEELMLHPTQLNISFTRNERINADEKISTRNPFVFFLNALLMTLGNVNVAPLRFNSLSVSNAKLSLEALQERVVYHYQQELYGQLYRILGSADILGNPVGLFNNVSSGIKDIFYEPYLGVIHHGGKEVGIGIARGAGSFFKKTLFGVSDSMTKITGSIGKGLSVATLDKDFQARRRVRQTRNKPKHALYGVTAGANSLVTAVSSGFQGLAQAPIDGAEQEGAVGFFKGLGRGVVGAVTKPVVGVFDLANNVAEGVRNTTTALSQNPLERARLPRFIAADGVLRPYQEREALGLSWLRVLDNGAFANEKYVAHIDINVAEEPTYVILTTTKLIQCSDIKLSITWVAELGSLSQINLESEGIQLVLKGGAQGPWILIPETKPKLWFFGNLEKVVSRFNSSSRK